MKRFKHTLEPSRTSDGKVIYLIYRDGVVSGFIMAVYGGYTVVDGPPGSAIMYSTMAVAYVGEDGIEPNVPYRCKNGKFVRVNI